MMNGAICRNISISSSTICRSWKWDLKGRVGTIGVKTWSSVTSNRIQSTLSSTSFNSSKSNEFKSNSIGTKNIQKRSLNAIHQYIDDLDEQLRHVELSDVGSALNVEEKRKQIEPQRKTLIQGKGIEGVNNTQRLLTNAEGKIDINDSLENPSASASLWVAPTFESDLIVVLDMDECLIHAQFLGKRDQESDWNSSSPDTDDKYRQYESERQYSPSGFYELDKEADRCDSFKINLPDGELVRINKRPHLTTFLSEVCSAFETYIFTAAMPVYACPVLDKLDPKNDMLQGRFYRESCALDEELGVYVKDLQTVLGNRKIHQQQRQKEILEISQRSKERIVLIDNNPLSFLANPSNGILVSNFYDDPHDQTLLKVLDVLMDLGKMSCDVRPQLDRMFGLKDALKEVMPEE